MEDAEVGAASLGRAFGGFCERWGWAVRGLVQDGREMATRLGLCAESYQEMDAWLGQRLVEALKIAVGDPHASDEQAAASSWASLAHQALTPDYSAESWRHAGSQIGQTWTRDGRELRDGLLGPLAGRGGGR